MIDVKLEEYLSEMRTKEFEWGKLDCVLFACDWCERHVGVNPAEGSHRQYNSEESAFEHLKQKYGSIEEGLDKHFSRVEKNYLQKGDIVLCHFQEQDILGIVGARGFVFFKSKPTGVFAKRNPEFLAAWRVE